MYILHVFIHVKPEYVEAFKTACIDNASNSLKEPGVVRFDFLQQAEDPNRFALVEVYRSKEDATKHKETAHYNRWREAIEPLQQEPRARIIYQNIYPTDEGWG